MKGHQRYKCTDCGCQFANTKPRCVSPALKQLAVVLYAHCDMSMSGIAKLFNVNAVAVLKMHGKIIVPGSTRKSLYHKQGSHVPYCEQTNSDIRYRSARFKRKTKASSRSLDMVKKSLKLFHFFQDNAHHVAAYMAPLITSFG